MLYPIISDSYEYNIKDNSPKGLVFFYTIKAVHAIKKSNSIDIF